jgi:hypothetical protein
VALARRAASADDARMPWHLRSQKGLNPTTPEAREREVQDVVTRHGGTLDGFWLTEDDRTSYALIDATNDQIRAITRDLDARPLKKVKAKK